MNHVIETVGPWGVKTTPYEFRRATVKPGDIVEFSEELRKYPVSHRLCRVNSVDQTSKMVSLVDGMGSAFLCENGNVSISGGPFFSVPLETLLSTIRVETSHFWNWGDNSPGAAQGVDYYIPRPIFEAQAHPYRFQVRYATSQKQARNGGTYKHEHIPQTARLVRSWAEHDGLTGWLFDTEDVNETEDAHQNEGNEQ